MGDYRVTSQYDHYKEAEDLIVMLHDTRLRNHSDALKAAMDEGATGTEIFMALRWNIEKLLNEKTCSEKVFAKAKRLWEELDKALR